MRRPIVVGIDPLEPDRGPLVAGAALARLSGAPLIAVASYLHDSITNAVSSGRVDEDLRTASAAALDAAAAGIEAERLVVPGSSASHALHIVAAERDAGLVVVGSSRRGAFGRVAPGSTAERLLHGTGCPVAVVPAGLAEGWAPDRVGVGYVALEEGEHALTAGAALARLAGGALEAVTAVAPATWGKGASVPPYGLGDVETARKSATLALRRALTAAGRDAAEGTVVTGEPVAALVALSERVDVLVCGSRGYGPVRSVLLGGVGHALLRDARCPVIVIPRGADDALWSPSPRMDSAFA
jgi:nucleotide-binding universal stress UspA family protein